MTRLLILGNSRANFLVAPLGNPFQAVDIWGNDGNDTLWGGLGDDILRGGAGQDYLLARGGDDLLLGGDGQDTLVGGQGSDTLEGGAGQDLLQSGGGHDLLLGGEGQDTLVGGQDGDTLNGGEGHDLLQGGASSDVMWGGAGQDELYGGGGADALDGGAGHDALFGGAGDDLFTGGAGQDEIHGGAGRDTAIFQGVFSDYQITDMGDGGVMVRGITATGRLDGRDSLTSVELLRFADVTIEVNGVPAAPLITGFTNDTGILGDALTADRSISLTGTAASFAQVEIFADGASLGSVTAASNGTWSYTTISLADGAYDFAAQATKGGLTSAVSAPLTLTIDATAPGAPSFGLLASSDSGVRGDDITAYRWTDLVGEGEAGATVTLMGTGLTTQVGADGQFRFGNVELDVGVNSFTVEIRDAAGNATLADFDITRVDDGTTDPVQAWNFVSYDAIRISGLSTAIAARVLAIESIAIMDTLAAIDGTAATTVSLDAPEGISAPIAAAAAAHRSLSVLYASNAQAVALQASFDARLAEDLAQLAPGELRDASVAFGVAVADAVLALRANDGSNAVVTYTLGSEPGEWRPTPRVGPGGTELPGRPAQLPQWGDVKPFLMEDGAQFRPDGPPAMTSAEYTAEFNEVKSLGALNSTTRTAEQTEIAFYWRDLAGTYSPAGRWAQIAGEVLEAQGHSSASAARIMAAVNLVGADGAIAAWDAKYAYNFWRPITAIREADTDGNPDTIQDASWKPLIETPPHPDYTSGHATCSAAAAWALTYLLGDDIAFTNASIGLPNVFRSFDNFVDAATEAARSRIYGGIHFTSAGVEGLELGKDVADYGMAKFFASEVEDIYAPILLLDAQATGPLAAPPVLTGYALDNRDGLEVLRARLDGGAALEVAVNDAGRFTLDAALFGPIAAGAHSITLEAEDAVGLDATPVIFTFTLIA